MTSLLFRNLLFTILQPGIVTVLIPYLILKYNSELTIGPTWKLNHITGSVLYFSGLIALLFCIIQFAIHGRGTLSPADPTKKLVISGLYRFSRNPMYVAVILMLIGEAAFFHSILLGLYSILIFLIFNLYIHYFEEPRLRKDFSSEYKTYCQKVNRWI